MKNKIQIIVIPTEDKSTLYLFRGSTLHIGDYEFIRKEDKARVNQHLYITVSQDVEPIKKGDWYLYDSKIWNQKECVPKYHSLYGRKIIATTDTKLTKGRVIIGTDGTLYKRIAQPSKSFLKEFVDNPNGEFEVEYEVAGSRGNTTIPELFYNLKLNQDNTVNITSVKEKMYSRDDLWKTVAQSHIARKSMQNVFNDLPNWFDNWIKENL